MAENFVGSKETIEQAARNLDGNKIYQNLKKKWQAAKDRGQYIQQINIQQQMRQMEQKEITRLSDLEFEKRKTVDKIMMVLEGDERIKYRVLMDALSFCFDCIDFLYVDINALLHQNKVGAVFEHFQSVKDAREDLKKLVDRDFQKMDQWQKDIYSEASDKVYDYVKERAGVYFRKCGRKYMQLEKQMKKDED